MPQAETRAHHVLVDPSLGRCNILAGVFVMSDLKPCPCGKTPSDVSQYGSPYDKWVWASPDCCGEWSVEYRSGYAQNEDDQKRNAEFAWNNAPRAKPSEIRIPPETDINDRIAADWGEQKQA